MPLLQLLPQNWLQKQLEISQKQRFDLSLLSPSLNSTMALFLSFLSTFHHSNYAHYSSVDGHLFAVLGISIIALEHWETKIHPNKSRKRLTHVVVCVCELWAFETGSLLHIRVGTLMKKSSSSSSYTLYTTHAPFTHSIWRLPTQIIPNTQYTSILIAHAGNSQLFCVRCAAVSQAVGASGRKFCRLENPMDHPPIMIDSIATTLRTFHSSHPTDSTLHSIPTLESITGIFISSEQFFLEPIRSLFHPNLAEFNGASVRSIDSNK